MLTHKIAKSAAYLNLFCDAIIYPQFIFTVWLLAGKYRADLHPEHVIQPQAFMTCSSSHKVCFKLSKFSVLKDLK